MALTDNEMSMLMNRLAVKHRVELAQLQQYTLVQLRELWRILEQARDAETFAAAARNGFSAVLVAQQTNSTVIAGALLFGAGEVYKASGRAPTKFAPTAGDTSAFVRETAPTLTQAAAREAGYHLSRAVRGETTRTAALKQLEGVAQQAQLNSSREFITQEALRSPHVEATEEVEPLASRYAPKVEALPAGREHYKAEESVEEVWDAIQEEDASDSWLNEDFLDGKDAEYEEWAGWEEGASPADTLDKEKIERIKKENKNKPSPVETDVRAGGCDYCKIVSIGKGPHKWHKHCNCVNLPKYKGFKGLKRPWDDEYETLYYQARELAENQITEAGSYPTMDDIMREIRILQYAEKNRERIANGEAPRKPYKRKPPKSLKEKQDIAMRNAARVYREKSRGRW